MKKLIIYSSVACAILNLSASLLNLKAVQPPIGGVFEMAWDYNTNDIETVVWESTNGAVNWRTIGFTFTNNFKWTNNNITPAVFYSITSIRRGPITTFSERRFLHWAPTGTNIVTNASTYARLTTAIVTSGVPIKVSTDLQTWEDVFTLSPVGSNLVSIQHKVGAIKPSFFVGYPIVTNPPILFKNP